MLSDYHDAEIVGINQIDDETIKLTLRIYDGSDQHILVKGCRLFRADNYGLQNVVSRVFIPVSRDDILELLRSALRADNDVETLILSESEIQDIVTEVVNGNLILFSVEPSIGAEVVILCRHLYESKSDRHSYS